MIETIMFFALGFLAASLIALVLLSAVWHRAVRLTTRRIEGAIPVSMSEIQADKDQLRAEFAMSTRRLETSVEQLKLKATEQLAEIGRKSDAVRQIKADLEEKTAAVASLEGQDRALRDKLRSTEEELTGKARELHETETELASRTNELAQVSRSLSEKTMEADSQRVEIVALETQCDTLKHRVTDLEREVADTEERLAQASRSLTQKTAEGDSQRIEILALQTQGDTLKHRVAELEREVAATEEQLAKERGTVERTTRTLAEEREKTENLNRRVADQERLLTEARAVADNMSRNIASLEGEVRRQAEFIAERERELVGMRAEAARYREETLAARRDAESAARAFNSTIETLKSEKTMLEGALVQLREDRTRLQQEVAAYKHQAETAWASERVENALLRERINDVAAEVARLTAALEGPGSPIDAIVAAPEQAANANSAPRRPLNSCQKAQLANTVSDASTAWN
jgi:predicted  nucleic acid-binding Zn-ribbon protein